MSNCCLFENPGRDSSRKIFDLMPLENLASEKAADQHPGRAEHRERLEHQGRLEHRERVVTEVALVRPTHEISVIRPQPARALTSKSQSKSARTKPTVRAFVELMLAAASLLFLALS